MECFSPVRQLGAGEAGGRWPSVWERIIEQNSNKIFDTIDVRKSLQIITDIAVTGPEMSCLSNSDSEMLLDSLKQSKKRLN